MLRSELHYDLPPELIAQTPAERRDASRLLLLDRTTGELRHEQFARLPDLLPPGALLVFNNTRVLPARLQMRRTTGGRLDALFLRESEPGLWELMMTGAARVKPGEPLALSEPGARVEDPPGRTTGARADIQRLILVDRIEGGTWRVRPDPPGSVVEILSRWGSPPLPPYILRERGKVEKSKSQRVEINPVAAAPAGDTLIPPTASRKPQAASPASDVDRYQTVYACEPGAVAAPTAGLHFTPELLDLLRMRGFETHFVTLHVGTGTFAPIRADDLADHEMHAEWYHCPESVASAVNTARAAGRPIVAVGTTSVRVLETCAQLNQQRETSEQREPIPPLTKGGAGGVGIHEPPDSSLPRIVRPGSGWTRLFIYPPYPFRVVDAMITNFHLPESTLLAMLFAFAGRETVLAAYDEAIRHRYRFYSYGDAMLLL